MFFYLKNQTKSGLKVWGARSTIFQPSVSWSPEGWLLSVWGYHKDMSLLKTCNKLFLNIWGPAVDPFTRQLKIAGRTVKFCSFGPSGVRALPLAAGINVGGHYFRYFFTFLVVLVVGVTGPPPPENVWKY